MTDHSHLITDEAVEAFIKSAEVSLENSSTHSGLLATLPYIIAALDKERKGVTADLICKMQRVADKMRTHAKCYRRSALGPNNRQLTIAEDFDDMAAVIESAIRALGPIGGRGCVNSSD